MGSEGTHRERKYRRDHTTLSGTTSLTCGRVSDGLPRRFLRGPGDEGRTFSACPLFSPISQNRKSRGSDIWTGSAKWQEKKQGRGKRKDKRLILDPETGCPNFFSLKANYKIVEQMIEEGMVASACAVGYGGIAEALFKMGLGNHIVFKVLLVGIKMTS